MLLHKIIEIITDPFKALIATASGTAAGTIPKAATYMSQTEMTNFDKAFQHTVWLLTVLVAISALISFGQKQIDRYKSKNNSNETNS